MGVADLTLEHTKGKFDMNKLLSNCFKDMIEINKFKKKNQSCDLYQAIK